MNDSDAAVDGEGGRDFRAEASAVVLAASEAVRRAGMDRSEFAAYLSDALDRGIPPEELEFWEIGGSMPGDVMLLCAAVIREALAAVPDSPVPANVRLLADRMSRCFRTGEVAADRSPPAGMRSATSLEVRPGT